MKRSAASVLVREGSVRIRIWPNNTRRADGRVYRAWQFGVPDDTGKVRYFTRANLKDAEAAARKMAAQLAAGQGTVFTPGQAAQFLAVERNLAGEDASPEVASWEYAKARQRLRTVGCDSLEAAVTFYLDHHSAGVANRSIADVCTELVDARKAEGVSWRHLKDLRLHLDRFAADVKCRLPEVSGLMIEAWLAGLTVRKGKGAAAPASKRYQRNLRSSLSNLFTFARKRKYVPKNFDPIKDVPLPKLGEAARGVLRPFELKLLLEECRETILPVLAIGSFAGLRQSEVLLLDWGDIDWANQRIRVSEEGKTGGRWAPLLSNLRAWLEPLRGEGRIVRLKENGVSNAIARAVAKVNARLKRESAPWRIKWPRNAARHSFVSYRCALLRNVALVADETGHSINELKASYRNQRVTPEEATAWFDLKPDTAQNLLQFDFGKGELSPTVPRTENRR